MELILTTFGTYLHRRGELFVVRIKEQQQEVAARKVRSILITTGASLSTDAIQLAIEKNIDIVFLDRVGDPYARVWHGRPGSTTAIRRAQLRLADTEAGLRLALGWVVRKLDNQIRFLGEARSRRSRLSAELTRRIEALRVHRDALDALDGLLDAQRETVMGIEGRAGRTYWEAVNLLLPESQRFDARSRNPARDPFNCLLNYSYGVLYGTVERACILAGLDPYVGFVHTDHYRKKSLVFDLIECYRIWADETVVGLFAARKVKPELFDPLHNGLILNKQGKAVLMERFGAHLDEQIRYRNRRIKRRDSVQLDCHRLANDWIGRGPDEDD
ncbi:MULTISPECIES: CRISPR-associated endonuclease Cas1 [Marichromatium]|uniref:CRISPR-associated endonuclease Cas1 n=1 Tax=Marichromatium gracile TaxID=1048 RepID=A0A4R4AHC2_MARGR|nr:CRISPR-associated endonuclease Cas1 [Marichromatium gracile]MBK1708346.1 CRISPR-associated endonuclease Cas1 [Marichromatium gracile]TCW38525.1 CRISPR-associated Cas1 family protein [Marichromatium gracile]